MIFHSDKESEYTGDTFTKTEVPWEVVNRKGGCHNGNVSSAEFIELEGQALDPGRLAELCERYGVAELAVFGSVARGEASGDSDIDLLYELRPGARLGFDLFDLEDGLTEVFGRPVDLVSKSALHRLIRHRVLADARTLYAA